MRESWCVVPSIDVSSKVERNRINIEIGFKFQDTKKIIIKNKHISHRSEAPAGFLENEVRNFMVVKFLVNGVWEDLMHGSLNIFIVKPEQGCEHAGSGRLHGLLLVPFNLNHDRDIALKTSCSLLFSFFAF